MACNQTGTIRVRASEGTYGYRPGEEDLDYVPVIVPPGTEGALTSWDDDGYVVRWDLALLLGDPTCGEKTILRDVLVSTDVDTKNSGRVPNIQFVSFDIQDEPAVRIPSPEECATLKLFPLNLDMQDPDEIDDDAIDLILDDEIDEECEIEDIEDMIDEIHRVADRVSDLAKIAMKLLDDHKKKGDLK